MVVVEKESRFRDRIRGELTWPWGHHEALRAGLAEPLVDAGVVPLPVLDFYQDRHRVDAQRWADIAVDALPAVGPRSGPPPADAFITVAAGSIPEGTLDDARPAGPLGFFSNSCAWPDRIAGGHTVLIGDAAGSLDPTQGLGTSMLFRDVRALSELLLADRDWQRATTEFERQRRAYFRVLRAYDRWCALLDAEEGPEADRRRQHNAAARDADPTLGGFAMLEARGPDGLVPDEAARRRFFGEQA